ncbi:MAG: hypothetical protein APF76_10465 [Desulfitibacter sp. BRH_c19]|nr:MAG: hypothetical protein APF76_10465 [Desulfitibacter sp. BRH_c19]
MGNVIWNNKEILEFESNYKEFLIASCNSKNINYILDTDNVVIFPALYDKTIILKMLSEHEELKETIKTIENSLTSEGATVLIDGGETDKQSLGYLDAQILLSFSFSKNNPNLTIYLPFSDQEISLSLIKKLLRHLNLLDRNITYKVASFWGKITATKYWNYLYGNPTPTMVFELGIPSLPDKFLSNFGDSLLKSLVEEFSYKPNNEEIESVVKYFNDVTQRLSADTSLSKEQHQLNELLAKLELQEAELDALKRSYIETEEIIKEINTEKNQEKVELNEKMLIVDNQTQEEQKPNKKNNLGTNKNRKTRKKKETKAKKLYMPISKKEQSNLYKYNHLPYPVRIPEGGPVYEFMRPNRETKSIDLPTSLTPKNMWGSQKISSKNYNYQVPISTFRLPGNNTNVGNTHSKDMEQKKEIEDISSQEIIESMKDINTAQETNEK